MQPGMPDLGQLFASAQRMQEEMAQAQAQLAASRVTGSAGGGLVTAVLSGDGTLEALTINPSVVDPADIDTLADLIVAAVRDGQRAVGTLSADAMSVVTGDLASTFGSLGLAGTEVDADLDFDVDADEPGEDDPDGDEPDGDHGDGPGRGLQGTDPGEPGPAAGPEVRRGV